MTTINLSDSLVEDAKKYANIFSRSTPKQIEHWAKIGKLAEENPDLPYEFIQQVLFSLHDIEEGNVEDYEFGSEGYPE